MYFKIDSRKRIWFLYCTSFTCKDNRVKWIFDHKLAKKIKDAKRK